MCISNAKSISLLFDTHLIFIRDLRSHHNRLNRIKTRRPKYRAVETYGEQMSVMKMNNARFNERGWLILFYFEIL
jgi:hypothetical protein